MEELRELVFLIGSSPSGRVVLGPFKGMLAVLAMSDGGTGQPGGQHAVQER